MKKQGLSLERNKDRLFNMVSVGVVDDRLNQGYDILSTLLLVTNLAVSFAMTFDNINDAHYNLLHWLEAITVLFFAIDYVLRLYTSDRLYPDMSRARAAGRYILSGYGIIDLLSFLPYYLPVFFPSGAAVFRMFRVIRIFRLFRINAYSDSLSLIGKVLTSKRTQILASIFIIILLILASSLCMYSFEHEAQPDVFVNAFSGLWWATSTMLTVGYGDIYPITIPGQITAIILTFLGVGLVALPTGIISAGFVEEYQRALKIKDVEMDQQIHFIEVELKENDIWNGKMISELGMPRGTLIASVIRGDHTIIPRGNVILEADDKIIICAESVRKDYLSDLHEIILRKNHTWNGQRIRDLDISRQSFIILINRNGRMNIPDGDFVLREGDKILIYTKENLRKYNQEPLF